jgi:hypothetical protein
MNESEEGVLWVTFLRLSCGRTSVIDAVPLGWKYAKSATSGASESFENNFAFGSELDRAITACDSNNPHPDRERNRTPGDPLETDPGSNNKVKTTSSKESSTAHCSSTSPPLLRSTRTRLNPPHHAHSERLCVVCMERPADLQLLPCRHDRFCCRCIVEVVGAQTRPEAPPPCPLCRAPFDALVITRPA